ncbi:HNH endonuclease signature motif containing protein [uncultured Chitinophaga sp.]|uniref:HNH endonuclease signature motif containing protein n=1 Tax=uncultured Chitinophaga sp. TaxID=339340 RepID=UPI0025F166CA|nr:HNH endonuclease signature motif containing protein [uncultured Chitinophaga sp.]
MAKIYLDALLPREDFDFNENLNGSKKKESFSISDLRESDFFYSTLRKPDFQRETNEWGSDKICELVKSFLNEELIPAVILWQSKGGNIFVIDGSHRVSSLIAWINDDYGDGQITKMAFDGLIPDEQIELAKKTRKLIEKEIGAYADYALGLKHPEKVRPEIAQKARRLGSIAVQLQWVEGDAASAEASFFKINQHASKIDPTELKLIQSRKLAGGIASRAIIKAGKGHQYWNKFTDENIMEIVSLSKEVNELLFLPKMTTPIKTLDLPIGGKGYSNQSALLIFEFVNLVNKVGTKAVPEDYDGALTVEYLKCCRKIVRLINANHISSLGLHPAVYFYSKTGKHKTASFFAVTDFLIELDNKKALTKFTKIRDAFEDMLIEYDFLIQQIVRQYRGASPAMHHIKSFYENLMKQLSTNSKDKVAAIKAVMAVDNFKFLKLNEEDENVTASRFSDETKSSAFIIEALDNALRCKICGARIHANSISIDHKIRKEDGGKGNLANAQLTHPYCNSGVKN